MMVKIILGIGILLFTLGCVAPSETIQTNTNENTLPNESPIVTETPVENNPTPTTFTLTEISTHAQPSDCWTTISGKVYDITDFVNGHPGGPGILAACGIDGTTLFETRSGNGPHPPSAEKTLEKYYVGELTS